MINKQIVFLTLFLILLPGCASRQAQLGKPLRPLHTYLDFQETKDNVTIMAKKFSRHDCMRAFGPAGKSFLGGKRHIKPIQLSITNDTQNALFLLPENIDLPILSHNQVARHLQKNPGFHAFMLGIGFIILSAACATGGILIAILGSGFGFSSLSALITGAALAGASPFLLIVGTPIASAAHSSEIKKENRMIKKHMKEKTVSEAVVIGPNQTKDLVIFVEKKKYKPGFDVKLVGKEELVFAVVLNDYE